MNDPNTLRKEVTVNVPQQKAFEVFTSGFDRWWPRSHHVAKVEMKEAVLEPKLGGRWYEKGIDGSECEWGKVTIWGPFARFAVTWQLTADYQYDPDFVTEVEVTFEPIGPNQTHVVLQHKHLDRYGDKRDAVKASIGNEKGGWGGILRLYAAIATNDAEKYERELQAMMTRMSQQ